MIFKTHLQNIHRKNIESVKYSCIQCDKEFTLDRNLKTHLKSVHKKIKYPCNQCDKQFTKKQDVKRHIESVHEKVKYP